MFGVQRSNNRERRVRSWATAILTAAVAAAIAAGCGNGQEGGSTAGASATAPPATELPRPGEQIELDPAEFTTEIDNPWWPMAPGSRWVYRETSPDGPVQRVVVTVTDETKVLADGVEARVVHDVASEGGVPIEVTDDYYAQDSAGNIWYLGEATAEYEDGKVVSREGSFESGVDGAEAGVIVAADPQPGMTYRQEHYSGHAEDQAEVVAIDAQAEVPFGHFAPVLMTADTNPLEPEILEFKFYAQGIGPVLAAGVSGSADREELISFRPGG